MRNLRVARHHVRAAWGAVAAPSAARKAAMVRAWASRASNKAVARYAEAVAAAGTEAPKGLAVATDAAYSAIRMREQVRSFAMRACAVYMSDVVCYGQAK